MSVLEIPIRLAVNVASPLVHAYDHISNTLSSATSFGLSLLGGPRPLPAHKPSSDAHPCVLVTGASSGIGRATALALAEKGYTVFATVRKQQDGDAIKSNRIYPILMDVTDAESITRAADTVRTHLTNTHSEFVAVVNVAGIILLGPYETTTQKDLQHQFNVNFYGPIAVSKAFLPFLKASHGRIINIGSVASFLYAPSSGLYSASKAALHAATLVMRMELRPFGIGVSLIEPGCIRTRAWDVGVQFLDKYQKVDEKSAGVSSEARFLSVNPSDGPSRSYAPLFSRLGVLFPLGRLAAFPTSHVTQHVEHAITSQFPRDRYLAGPDAKVADVVLKFVPQSVVEWAIGWVLW
ncbi:hypothetical protein SpCBS45565_g07654 [Spizellomyces sp. 'palustris']|nr:hypothetical protein SpCBS45565_g07654 [Spizellomyces sp. 'palustris']